MKPQVKVFTRDNPCKKIDIWNTFKGVRGWKRVQVDQAHAVMGLNAPKNMLKNEYLDKVTVGSSDYYKLTEVGITWLVSKFKNYLMAHPNDRNLANNVPKGF